MTTAGKARIIENNSLRSSAPSPGLANVIYMKNLHSVRALFMANINRIVSLCLPIMLAVFVSSGRAETYCDPVVEPLASDTTLVRTLSRIAEEYDFKLSIHESLDRPVRLNKSMTLARLIKHLTVNMSTVTKHKKVDDCASPVITHLIVLPVGKETAQLSEQPSCGHFALGLQPLDEVLTCFPHRRSVVSRWIPFVRILVPAQ